MDERNPFYIKAKQQFDKRTEEYNRSVREWYTEGDGRPVAEGGRGHSYPYCIHGTSLWTDYDNICGGCESDEDDQVLIEYTARAREDEYHERVAAAINLAKYLGGDEIFTTIMEKVVTDYYNKHTPPRGA